MRLVMVALAAALVAGCGEKAGTTSTEATMASAPTSASGGVAREEVVAPTPTPTPAPAVAIQEQPGPNGATVRLTRVAVTGDVLTVQLSYVGGSIRSDTVPIDQVSVIDDATSRQIGVLKDGAGKWLAAPISYSKDQVRTETGSATGSVVWFKFPAPPATSRTVSINVPNVGPFDGVPVTR